MKQVIYTYQGEPIVSSLTFGTDESKTELLEKLLYLLALFHNCSVMGLCLRLSKKKSIIGLNTFFPGNVIIYMYVYSNIRYNGDYHLGGMMVSVGSIQGQSKDIM